LSQDVVATIFVGHSSAFPHNHSQHLPLHASELPFPITRHRPRTTTVHASIESTLLAPIFQLRVLL
jgi:hypothetical protein